MSTLTGLFYLQVPETSPDVPGTFVDLLAGTFGRTCQPYFTEPSGGIICYSTQFKTDADINPCAYFNLVAGTDKSTAYVTSASNEYLVPCTVSDPVPQCVKATVKYQVAEPDFAYVLVPCYPVFSLAIQNKDSKYVPLIYNAGNIASPWSPSSIGQHTKFQLLENTLWQLDSEFYENDAASKTDVSSAVTLEPNACEYSGTLQLQRVPLASLASPNPTNATVNVAFPAAVAPLEFHVCKSKTMVARVGFDATTGGLQFTTSSPKQAVYLVPEPTPADAVSASSPATLALLESLIAVTYPQFLGVNIPEVSASLTFNNSLDSAVIINGVSVGSQVTVAMDSTLPFSLQLNNPNLPPALGRAVQLSPLKSTSPLAVYFAAPYDFVPMLTYTFDGKSTISFQSVQSLLFQDIYMGQPGWFSKLTDPLFYAGATSNYPVVPNVPFIFQMTVPDGPGSAWAPATWSPGINIFYLSFTAKNGMSLVSDVNMASVLWFEPSSKGYYLKISTNDSTSGAFQDGSMYVDIDVTSTNLTNLIGSTTIPNYNWTLWLSTGDGSEPGGTGTSLLYPLLIAYKDKTAVYTISSNVGDYSLLFPYVVALPMKNLLGCTGIWTYTFVPNCRFLSPVESTNWDSCDISQQAVAQCWTVSSQGCPFNGPVCTIGQTKPGALMCSDSCPLPPAANISAAAVAGITSFLQNTCGVLMPASATWPCSDIAGAKIDMCSGFKQSLLRFPCERYGDFANSDEYASLFPAESRFTNFTDQIKTSICTKNSSVTTPECSCINVNLNVLKVPSRNNLSFQQFNCQLLNKFNEIGSSSYIDIFPSCWWPTCDPVNGGLITSSILSLNQTSCSSDFYDCQVLFDNPSDVNFISSLSQACSNLAAKPPPAICNSKPPDEPSIFETKPVLTLQPATDPPPAVVITSPAVAKTSPAVGTTLSPVNVVLIVVGSVLLAGFIALGVYEGIIHAKFVKKKSSLK